MLLMFLEIPTQGINLFVAKPTAVTDLFVAKPAASPQHHRSCNFVLSFTMAENNSTGACLDESVERRLKRPANDKVPAFHYYMRLPPELRHLVLFYAVPTKIVPVYSMTTKTVSNRKDRIDFFGGKYEEVHSSDPGPNGKSLLLRGANPDSEYLSQALSIFLVSKQFLNEASSVFFREESFRVSINPWDQIATPVDPFARMLGGPQSTSLIHQSMRALHISVPMDRVTAIIETWGGTLTTMINFGSLRQLDIQLLHPKMPKEWIHDGTPSEFRAAFSAYAADVCAQFELGEPTCLPSLNKFLAEGLPRIVALLTNPLLDRASLSVSVHCHPEVLCQFHRWHNRGCTTWDSQLSPCTAAWPMLPWGLRAGGEGERVSGHLDFQRIAKVLKENGGVLGNG